MIKATIPNPIDRLAPVWDGIGRGGNVGWPGGMDDVSP